MPIHKTSSAFDPTCTCGSEPAPCPACQSFLDLLDIAAAQRVLNALREAIEREARLKHHPELSEAPKSPPREDSPP